MIAAAPTAAASVTVRLSPAERVVATLAAELPALLGAVAFDGVAETLLAGFTRSAAFRPEIIAAGARRVLHLKNLALRDSAPAGAGTRRIPMLMALPEQYHLLCPLSDGSGFLYVAVPRQEDVVTQTYALLARYCDLPTA